MSSVEVGLNHYLILSLCLFLVGVAGVIFRKNAIVVLMSIELMLSAANISFVAFSNFMNHVDGQVLVFFSITVTAAKAGVGLALAVAIFRKFKKINIRFFEQLRG